MVDSIRTLHALPRAKVTAAAFALATCVFVLLGTLSGGLWTSELAVIPNKSGETVFLCISLPEAVERRRDVSKLISRFPSTTAVDYVYAIRGSDARQRLSVLGTALNDTPPICEVLYHRLPHEHSSEFFAVLGCALSHLKAIREASMKGVDWALIFEDDVVHDLLPFWGQTVAEFVESLPPGWFFVQLSLIGDAAMWSSLMTTWESASPHPQVMATKDFWSTGAYLISSSAIARVNDLYLLPNGKFNLSRLPCLNADMHLLKDVAPPGTYYVATPPLFTCAEDGKSFIHNNQSERTYIHQFSRKMSLDWSANAARSRFVKTEQRAHVGDSGAAALPTVGDG